MTIHHPRTEVELDPAAETLSGLKHLCSASCKDLLTREQALIHHSLGILSDAAMHIRLQPALIALFQKILGVRFYEIEDYY